MRIKELYDFHIKVHPNTPIIHDNARYDFLEEYRTNSRYKLIDKLYLSRNLRI